MKLLIALFLLMNFTVVAGECDFYQKLESEYQCHSKGYLINFGYKYCLKFINKKKTFSEDGQIWLANTRECLINELKNTSFNDCKELKKFAFDTHTTCYQQAGFCSLEKKDRKELYKMILPQFWRVGLIFDGLSLLRSCD
tara:strand:- start:332 stop:751 length:420 start_codon:yes stop_codon:yes gene_type:complete